MLIFFIPVQTIYLKILFFRLNTVFGIPRTRSRFRHVFPPILGSLRNSANKSRRYSHWSFYKYPDRILRVIFFHISVQINGPESDRNFSLFYILILYPQNFLGKRKEDVEPRRVHDGGDEGRRH